MAGKVSKKVEVDASKSYRASLVSDIGVRSARIVVASEADQVKPMQSELKGLEQSVGMLLFDLEGKRRPQIDDLVCGTVVAERGDETEWIRLYGKVTGGDELGVVCVKFDGFEFHYHSDEDFEPEAEGFLGREIATHAIAMSWDEPDKQWLFDL